MIALMIIFLTWMYVVTLGAKGKYANVGNPGLTYVSYVSGLLIGSALTPMIRALVHINADFWAKLLAGLVLGKLNSVIRGTEPFMAEIAPILFGLGLGLIFMLCLDYLRRPRSKQR